MELNDDFKQLIDDSTDEFFAYVGLMYSQGHGLSKDENKAKMWLQRSFDLGIDWAGCKLFDILFKENSVDQIISAIIEKASEGNSEFQARAARAYRDGKGVVKDLNKAAEWMRRAADQNLGWAKNELFDILWRIGTPKSYSEMIRVATSFAASGDGGAMGRLGRAYRDGKGVGKDLNKAAEWMRKAADQNIRWAHWELFDILWRINTPESLKEMIERALPLAESGNGEMQGRLGRAYRDGKGVGKDLNKAAEWMGRACDAKIPWAVLELHNILQTKNENNRFVLYDVSHYSLLTEAILIRMNHHPSDLSVLMVAKKTGKENLLKKLAEYKIFDYIIEYNPFYSTKLTDLSEIKNSISEYFGDLLSSYDFKISDFLKVYSGADLISSFYVYLYHSKVKPIIMESGPKQLEYKSRVDGARRLNMVSEEYGRIQEETGIIDGSNNIESVLKYANRGVKPQSDSVFDLKYEMNTVDDATRRKLGDLCGLPTVNGYSDLLLMNSRGHCCHESGLDANQTAVIYRTMVDYYSNSDMVFVKNHPESPTDVQNLISNSAIIGDYPIELLFFSDICFDNVLSIDTSATEKVINLGIAKRNVHLSSAFYKQFTTVPLLNLIVHISKMIGATPDVSGLVSSDLIKAYNIDFGSDNRLVCRNSDGVYHLNINDGANTRNCLLNIREENRNAMGLFADFKISIEYPDSLAQQITNLEYSKTATNLGLQITLLPDIGIDQDDVNNPKELVNNNF